MRPYQCHSRRSHGRPSVNRKLLAAMLTWAAIIAAARADDGRGWVADGPNCIAIRGPTRRKSGAMGGQVFPRFGSCGTEIPPLLAVENFAVAGRVYATARIISPSAWCTGNDQRPSTRWLALAGRDLLVCAYDWPSSPHGGDVGAVAVQNRDRGLAKNILGSHPPQRHLRAA